MLMGLPIDIFVTAAQERIIVVQTQMRLRQEILALRESLCVRMHGSA